MKNNSGMSVKKTYKSLCDNFENGIYYHYTSVEKMWLIFENETLRATQARFSNDKEEITKGIKALSRICGKIDELKDYKSSIKDNNLDSYIVCFCKNRDKLSQWRAYCKNDGVSLGFEFDEPMLMYYLSDISSEKNMCRIAENAVLHPVFYLIDENENVTENELYKVLREDQLKERIENRIENFKDDFAKRNAILSLIPFIKNAGFYEEEEYRLLVTNPLTVENDFTTYKHEGLVKYSSDDKLKKPYINIKFGESYRKDEDNVNTIYLIGNELFITTVKDVLYEISEISHKLKSLIFADEGTVIIKEICNSKENKIVIGSGNDENQKILFNEIDKINIERYKLKLEVFSLRDDKAIPIWCQGHLPIRNITVSPSEKQDYLINIIKHYCSHSNYWMKYIEVNGSTIPYRD